MDLMKDTIAAAAGVVDKAARVAFVTGGAWLLGSYAFQILGALLIEENEPTKKAA